MFRILNRACSRATSSTTCSLTPFFPSLSASFHTTRPALDSGRKERARIKRKRNIEFHTRRDAFEEQTAPHPVLGLPNTPQGEADWLGCDLARILVDEKAVQDAPILSLNEVEINLPELYQHGLGEGDERVLFESLPTLASTTGLVFDDKRSEQRLMDELQDNTLISRLQANYLSRILDLRNANAQGIAFENRRRCIKVFGETESDSGRPEVQAAILTAQIRNLWNHLQTHRKDVHNQRSLKTMVHKRAKILKYLERLDSQRFDAVLPRLGIDPRAIRGEIIVRFHKTQT
ncbi:S15/NS1 RNA-binding domain-containing protein [Dacryopinax primogenitus]|uniref:S15/NS1 RNA-binding domain-containing protein n=1 Tax=Dacryopinax primogenitus (strain DJM 731) TaxID=1858805 RepID=M5GDT8_DACPD|nr:S15/NS1 RNA-binding domain-containing protein [Dacryopinax primogenitus]EJU02678.1 S15/NS1 RNA-binding domain-containing protein [Dacryopinax primogenitus]